MSVTSSKRRLEQCGRSHTKKKRSFRTSLISVQKILSLVSVGLTNVAGIYKNSSGDEIANVNFCTTTTYM